MDIDEPLYSTEMSIRGNTRRIWFFPYHGRFTGGKNKYSISQTLAICLETTDSIHIYELYEFLKDDFDSMLFHSNNICECCKEEKPNTSTRISYDKEIAMPLEELDSSPEDYKEHICHDCLKKISIEVRSLIESEDVLANELAAQSL